MAIFVFILSLFTLSTAMYSVPRGAVAMLKRFGKYVHDVLSGLHLASLWVSIQRRSCQSNDNSNKKMEFPGRVPPNTIMRPKRKKKLVTGDVNAALVEWAVQ